MTHAPFHAPIVHAAAQALHTRLRARADANGIGSISAVALHSSGDLARFAAAAGDATMALSLDDFGLIAADMPALPIAVG